MFMCYSVYRLCVYVLFCIPFVCYSVYCVCVFYVLYYCHRVSAHLQFINNNNNYFVVALKSHERSAALLNVRILNNVGPEYSVVNS